MEEKELRRALLTLRQAGEIELRHVYGEINSLWKARETVREFLRETSMPAAPSVGTAAREPIAERRNMDTSEQTTETIEITRCVHHYMPGDFPILKYNTAVEAVAALFEWYKSDRDYIRREWDKDKQRLRQARIQRDSLLKQIADSAREPVADGAETKEECERKHSGKICIRRA